MRIYYDTEFLEQGPGHPIEFISIGMVRDDTADLVEHRQSTNGTWCDGCDDTWPCETARDRREHR